MDSIAAGPSTGVARAPSAAVLCAVVVAGLAGAACTILLVLTSDHIPEPGVHAGLAVWGILGFILAGVVAWWRRPESRFGILMVLAGTAWFLSTLASANLAIPYTIGITFDLVPAVVFLHVVLAFPNGRLERPFERVLVGVGYATAFGIHVLGMTLGGFGPDNLFEVASRDSASHRVENAQLVVISALCLTGVVLLAIQTPRRRAAAAALTRAPGGLVRARTRDVRVPLPLRRVRIGQWGNPVRDDPAGDVLRRRTRAARLPRRPPPRPPGPVGGRRPHRRAAGRPDAGRPPRRPVACTARPVADARVLAARVRDVRRPRRPAHRACRPRTAGAR